MQIVMPHFTDVIRILKSQRVGTFGTRRYIATFEIKIQLTRPLVIENLIMNPMLILCS